MWVISFTYVGGRVEKGELKTIIIMIIIFRVKREFSVTLLTNGWVRKPILQSDFSVKGEETLGTRLMNNLYFPVISTFGGKKDFETNRNSVRLKTCSIAVPFP